MGTPLSGRILAMGLICFLVTAGPRFWGLEGREPWLDENCTFYVTHYFTDWPAGGPERGVEVAHVPYFVLLSIWTHLGSESILSLRAFSAVSGILGVLSLVAIAYRLGGIGTALFTFLLAGLHPLHVHYSREARVYAFWMLIAVACTGSLFRAARSLQKKAWLGYAAWALIGVMTHYYTVFWLAATWTAVLISPDGRRFMRQWLMTHAIIGVGLLPVLLPILAGGSTGGPRGWLSELWSGYPTVAAPIRSLLALLLSGPFPGYLGSIAVSNQVIEQKFGPVPAFLVHWVPALVLTLLILSSWKNRKWKPARTLDRGGEEITELHIGSSSGGRTICCLLALSFVFFLNASLFSLAIRPLYVVGRYDVFAWPAIVLVVALLVTRRGSQRSTGFHVGRVACAVLLGSASAATTWASLSVPGGDETRRRAERIAELVERDELVVCLGMYQWFMFYEWHRLALSPRVRSFPAELDRRLCWDDPESALKDPRRLEDQARTLAVQVVNELTPGRRVWLLAHGEPAGPRWEVEQYLFRALMKQHVSVEPVDEWVGLAQLVQAGTAPPGGERTE